MSAKRFGMEEKMKLGEKIVKLRKEKGLSQEALAKALCSETVREYIEATYNGSVVPMF